MATWAEFEAEQPEMAASVRVLFDAHRHKTMATVRKDGGPRISGIEVGFAGREVVIGMSAESMKARDLARDARVAIHSNSDDPPEDGAEWAGDAKIAGRAHKTADPDNPEQPVEESGQFRIEIDEVVLIRLGGDPPDHMRIEAWHAGIGVQLHRR